MHVVREDCVLLVGDAPTNAGPVRTTLERAGIAVLVATDGASAVRQADDARPSLVLLDVNAPGIDGWEICRTLRADPATADLPVIFIAASGDLADKTRAFRDGAVDCITRPLHADEVIARVDIHLKLRRLIRELTAANSELKRRSAGRPSEAQLGDGSLEDVERRHIIEVLRRTRGVVEGPRGAARVLGLKPSTARFRMKKLGISKADLGS